MNCKTEVPEGKGKFFGGESVKGEAAPAVFVCETCHAVAESFHARGMRELQRLFIVFKDSIRVALIEGRLHFGEDYPRDMTKEEVLNEIVRMEEENQSYVPSSSGAGPRDR